MINIVSADQSVIYMNDSNGNNSGDTISPTVNDVNPVNKAVNVPANSVILVNFSEPVKKENNWIELKNSSGTTIPFTMSINNNSLTVMPNDTLKEDKYSIILHSGCVTDLAGNPLTLKVSSFSVGTSPTITSIDPINNTINVPPNKTITITLTELIKAGNYWIELKSSDGTLIPITKSINDNVLTVKPTNSLTEDNYTLILHNGCVTDLAGNPLTLSVNKFIVGTSPSVTALDPVNNAVNVDINKTIIVNFNEPIKTGNNYIELKSSNGTAIAFTKSVSGNVLTLKPLNPLTEDKYTLILHTGCVTDLAGNPLALKTSNFSVGTSPTITSIDPTNNASSISTDKTITINFNEVIKSGNNCIELKSTNGTIIPITISTNGSVLTITHSTLLAPGIKYNIILYSGCVTDLAGNPLALVNSTFSTMSLPVYITSDNIISVTTDTNRVNTIVNGLKALGLTAVNWGLGSNTHYSVLQSSSVPANALVVDIYGGACAGTIYEMGLGYYKKLVASRKVFCVWVPPATDITGLAWLPRAHDDDFSPPSFTGLAYPDQYLKNNGYDYIYSGDLNTIISAIYKEATINN